MARLDPQMKLRLTSEMHARIAEAAKRNGRSMNSEIISRLDTLFELEPFDTFMSAESLQEMLAVARSSRLNEERTLYVLLDTNGMPTSWDEVREHLYQITRNVKLNIHTMSTMVITPEMRSSDERKQELIDLARKYVALQRAKRKSLTGQA